MIGYVQTVHFYQPKRLSRPVIRKKIYFSFSIFPSIFLSIFLYTYFSVVDERDGPVRNINIVIPFLMNNATNATDDANANNVNNATAVSVRDILFGAKDEGTLGNGQIRYLFQIIK